MELSWIELKKLLDLVENIASPQVILIKRQHMRDEKDGYDFRVRTHYRYKDKTTLTASVAGNVNA